MRGLSRREAESVLLRAVGIQAKEGAQRMRISIHTYRAHLRHGLELVKLGNPQSFESLGDMLKEHNGILCVVTLQPSVKSVKQRSRK